MILSDIIIFKISCMCLCLVMYENVWFRNNKAPYTGRSNKWKKILH